MGRRNIERLLGLVESGSIEGAAATLIRLVDHDSVEASCLAHDLGTLPLGTSPRSSYTPPLVENSKRTLTPSRATRKAFGWSLAWGSARAESRASI